MGSVGRSPLPPPPLTLGSPVMALEALSQSRGVRALEPCGGGASGHRAEWTEGRGRRAVRTGPAGRPGCPLTSQGLLGDPPSPGVV